MAGKAKQAPLSRKQLAASSQTAIVSTTPRLPKAKDDNRSNNRETLELLKASINKQFKGKGAVQSGSEFTNVFTLRRPTGIIGLDIALGGGLPAGGLSQIIGEDGAGKSYLTNRVIANVQSIYGEDSAIAACMTEMAYDKVFAKWKCGVQIAFSDVEIQMLEEANEKNGIPPFDDNAIAWLKQETGIFHQYMFATAEQVLEAAVQAVESNAYQVVLIDSFGALLTKAESEAEEGLEGKHYGGASGVITQFMHRLHAALNLPDKNGRPNTTTVIGINQYRENLKASGPYANPLNIAGGRALKHGKLIDLLLEKGSKIWLDQPGGKKVMAGREVSWNLIKGKAGCHDGPKGSYKFYMGEYGYGFGADVYHDLLQTGLKVGVVSLSGAWYSQASTGEKICQGQDNAAEGFGKNPDLMRAVQQEILSKSAIRFITKETF